jgi:hypothetical protein
MNKLVASLFVLNIVLTSYAGSSSSKGLPSGFVDYAFNTKHSLTIAPEIYHYEYEEPGVMKTEGQYTGVHLDYFFSIYPDPTDKKNPYERVTRFFAGAESRYADGSVDYESNGTGEMDDIDDYVFEIRALLGFDATMYQSVAISPYVGFGYRYLNNDSSGRQTTTGHFGYERESNYYYIPLGARLTLSVASHTLIGGTIEADFFLYGKQKSHLDEVVINDQESGYGARASIFVEHDFKHVAVFIEPYIRYWNIDDSEITVDSNFMAWIEPENNTIEAGLMLGVRF